jgi:hypothetical protein
VPHGFQARNGKEKTWRRLQGQNHLSKSSRVSATESKSSLKRMIRAPIANAVVASGAMMLLLQLQR